MTTRFIHSIKVPRLYKESANIVKKVLVDGASFKSLVSKPNHPNVQGIYALVSETLQHCKELQLIIDETKILSENPQFNPYLAQVLITELLWGKKTIISEAKPVVTVLKYKEKLQQALMQISDAAVDPYDKKKAKLPRYVRINTLLTTIDEAMNAFYDDGWNLLPRFDNYSLHLKAVSNLKAGDFIQDFHIPEVFIFPPETKFYDHPGYLNGKLMLQDKASCLVAFLLNPKPGCEILEMCAAPGMKTTHLAAIVKNTGKIYAIEMNEKRYTTLCDFINHAQATIAQPIKADALTITAEQYPNIKYIVVDPSCSGSGMDRFEIRNPDEKDIYQRLKKLHSLQAMILGHALRNFPNVKKVIYSTCSIHPEENEAVVDEVLQKLGDNVSLVNLKKKIKNEWHSFASSEYTFNGDKCLYALPETDLCKGFFVAMFKRKSKKLESQAEGQESVADCSELEADSEKKIQENNEMPVQNSELSHKKILKKSKIYEIDHNIHESINNFSKSKKRKTVSSESKGLETENNTISDQTDIKEINESLEVPVIKIKKEKKKKKDKYDVRTEI